jgi:acyl-coenzyme A synthetase/AMP-(fatty) acid ligase
LQTVLDHDDVLDAAVVQVEHGVRVEAWFGDARPDEESLARLRSAVTRQLEAAGLADPQIAVEVTEHPALLPRTPAGKRRPIVAR